MTARRKFVQPALVEVDLPAAPRPRLVGSSLHTGPKHFVLDRLIAQATGAAQHLDWIERLLFVDCCAGDGVPTQASGTSSPAIMWKHHSASVKPSQIVLMDKAEQNVAELKSWLGPQAPIHHLDYHSPEAAVVVSRLVDRGTAVFLHVDPNSMNDVFLSPAMRYALLPAHTLMMVSLGCNVAGTKRLSFDGIRDQWYERIEEFLRVPRRYHDSCLIRLNSASDWGYLVSTPVRWKPDIERVISRARAKWPAGIDYAWASDPHAFLSLEDRLFKTHGERARYGL